MRLLFCLLLVLSGTTSIAAQWRLTLLHGHATTKGDARAEADPDHPELHADRPSTWSLSLSRAFGRWRLSADMHRTTADLAEVGGSSSITTNGVMRAWGTGLEIDRRIAGRAGGAELHAGAGVRLDRWTFDLASSSARTRAAAVGALEAGLPISGRWSAVLRWQVSAGPSVFIAAELPDGFSARTAWRTGGVLGVSRRF